MDRILRLVVGSRVPATVLFCAALIGWVQFQFDGLYDSDSYFHTRAASELDRNGIQREFPQTSFSTWKERYSDKDFLFHAALIPFQRWVGIDDAVVAKSPDLVRAGKLAVVFFDGVLFAAFALALWSLRVRFVPFWILLLFSSHLAFLTHILGVRPHLLGYAFVVLEVVLVARRSVWPLAFLGAVHTWTHSSFFLVPALGVVAALVFLLRREAIPRRTLAAAVLGPAATFVLHPFFPNNITIAWEQLFEVARSVWGIQAAIPRDLFGAELTAASGRMVLQTFAVWTPAALAVLVFLGLRKSRRVSTEGLALTAMTVVLLGFSLLSQRFFGFFFPVVVLLGAHLWTELAASRSLSELWRTKRAVLVPIVSVLFFCLAWGQTQGHVGKVRQVVLELPEMDRQRTAIGYLDRHAATEELVYHNFWWSFSLLYHYRPDGRYVVALDPVFFFKHAPDLFRKALHAYRGRLENLYEVLRDDFGAVWVYVPRRPEYQPFRRLVQADSRFLPAYEDRFVQIYRLQD